MAKNKPMSVKKAAKKAVAKVAEAKAAKEKSVQRKKVIDSISDSQRKLYNEAPASGRTANFDRYSKQQIKLGKMSRAEKVKQVKINQAVTERNRSASRAKAKKAK
jgi:hypothetical protein